MAQAASRCDPNGLPAGVPEAKTLEQIGRALRQVAEFGAGYGQEIRLEVHGRGTSDLVRVRRIMDIANHENAQRLLEQQSPKTSPARGLRTTFSSWRNTSARPFTFTT